MIAEDRKRLEEIKNTVTAGYSDLEGNWLIDRLEAAEARAERERQRGKLLIELGQKEIRWWKVLKEKIDEAHNYFWANMRKAETQAEALEADNRRLRGMLDWALAHPGQNLPDDVPLTPPEAQGREETLTLRILQEQQRPWVTHNFPGRDAYYPLLGAMEELGELSHAHLKQLQGIRGTTREHEEAKKDAVADIVIFLSDYCSANGIDFQKAVETTWAKVRQRDWKADPANGASGEQPRGGTGEGKA